MTERVYSMKRQEYLKALARYEEELARQDAKRSTGSTGKLADVILRDYILVHGIEREAAVRCRRLGKADVTRKACGKVEIKTGSGAVAYGSCLTKEDIVEENILPGVSLVCWAPFTAFLTKDNMVSMTWVFTREEFIETLEAIGKNGLQSAVKVSKGGAQLNIQTITPRMEDRLWDVLENQPTVEEYFGR